LEAVALLNGTEYYTCQVLGVSRRNYIEIPQWFVDVTEIPTKLAETLFPVGDVIDDCQVITHQVIYLQL